MSINKQITVTLDSLDVTRGNMFTVYLNCAGYGEERNALQVELRVRTDGKPEIYVDKDKVDICDFKSWYNMNPRPKKPQCSNCVYYKPCDVPNSDRVACGHSTRIGWPHHTSKCDNWSPKPAEDVDKDSQ